MRLIPGDPILTYISQNDLKQLSESDYETLRNEFGLDKPVFIQYINWVGGLFHGDFGTSIVYHDKVYKLLIERLPVTIHLGTLALLLSSCIGIFAGLLAAARRGKWLDTVTTFSANIGVTIPVFWLGILMIYFFGLKLRWFPVQGYTSPFDDFGLSTKQVIMPVICLCVISLSSVARQTRSSMLEVIRQDYIRTAWSKGLKEIDIIIKHVLKNGFIPIITLVGMQIPIIFGGSVLTETVFNVPGMGRLLVNGVLAQDFPIVQACCLVISIIVVFVNLLVDFAYGWIDPRVRYS
jgi:peptide/nickel transport system permease protein